MANLFHERFNISLGIEEAKRRFVNRLYNSVFVDWLYKDFTDRESRAIYTKAVVDYLGERYDEDQSLEYLAGTDYLQVLAVTEAMYRVLIPEYRKELGNHLKSAIARSEVDLGIRWEGGQYVPSGAKLLDDRLVNEPLAWMAAASYSSIREPYAKGLSHFVRAASQPELLSDVVTDMYEALEAAAKVVTKRDKDLSANREPFVKAIRASEEYKQLLRGYIVYANEFRHAVAEGRKKPAISLPEVESFMYLTGVFLRLAMAATSSP